MRDFSTGSILDVRAQSWTKRGKAQMYEMFISILNAVFKFFEASAGAAVLGACFGAITSGCAVYLSERRCHRIASSMMLIEQFTSPDFLEVRNDAGEAFRSVGDLSSFSIDTLKRHLDESGNNATWRKITKIDHFFQRLDLIVKLGEYDKRRVREYFSREFPHWYTRYFEPLEKNRAPGEPLFYPSLTLLFEKEISKKYAAALRSC